MIRSEPKPSRLEKARALFAGNPLPAPANAVAKEVGKLPGMIKAAAAKLASATNAAEVLDARDTAALVYDAAKRAARLAAAKGAHDKVVAAAHRAQADALDIESAAKRRIADEYDAAQERGGIVGRKGGGDSTVTARNAATAADAGLTRAEVHDGGLLNQQAILQVFASPDGRTFTIIATRVDGVACILFTGRDWQPGTLPVGGQEG